MENELLQIVHIGTDSFSCSGAVIDICDIRERTISYATFVSIPEEAIVVDEIYKECCYQSLVLADGTGKDHRNDYTGVFYKRQLTNEVCEFVLIKKSDNSEIQLNNGTFGVFKDFGSISDNVNLSTFILEWSKILEEYGEGAYQIRKDITITGISYSEYSNVFTLRTYSDREADKSIRIDILMSGLMEQLDIDFSGSGFKSSLRLGGFFGRREPKYEEDNIVLRSKKVEQISMKMISSYKLQTELIPECMTNQIFDFYLFADELFINDYNLNNHSYSYKKTPVSYENNEGTKYYTENRKARLNLTFKDKFANQNKINY